MKGGDPLPRALIRVAERFLRDMLVARDRQNFRKK